MSSGVDYVVYAGAGSPGLRLRRVKLLIAKCLPLRAPFRRGWRWRWFLSEAVFRRLFHEEPSKARRARSNRCYTMIVHDVSVVSSQNEANAGSAVILVGDIDDNSQLLPKGGGFGSCPLVFF